jgi:hypothetical protein
MGTYHNLSEEQKCSIIQAAPDNEQTTQKRFDKALTHQAKERRKKEEIAMHKKIDAA